MALILRVGPWAALTVCPRPAFLSVQAEEGRRALKAKIAKVIKEAILFFSSHHPFLYRKIFSKLTLFVRKSQQKKKLAQAPFR
jgi:hypothetical protein